MQQKLLIHKVEWIGYECSTVNSLQILQLFLTFGVIKYGNNGFAPITISVIQHVFLPLRNDVPGTLEFLHKLGPPNDELKLHSRFIIQGFGPQNHVFPV